MVAKAWANALLHDTSIIIFAVIILVLAIIIINYYTFHFFFLLCWFCELSNKSVFIINFDSKFFSFLASYEYRVAESTPYQVDQARLHYTVGSLCTVMRHTNYYNN